MKKKKWLIVLLVIAIIAAVIIINQCSMRQKDSIGYASVTAETQMLYEKANAESRQIGYLQQNDIVEVIAKTSDEWWLIRRGGVEGYCPPAVLTETDAPKTLEDLNLPSAAPTADPNSGETPEPGATPAPDPNVVQASPTEWVNMRKGPGTDYEIMRVLETWDVVEILDDSGSWYKVKIGDDEGYVYYTYLTVIEPKAE